MLKNRPSYALAEVHKYLFDEDIANAHRALGDVQALERILTHCFRDIPDEEENEGGEGGVEGVAEEWSGGYKSSALANITKTLYSVLEQIIFCKYINTILHSLLENIR